MEINAKDVMRLRAETGAPMMESKAALVEANGDFDRAKEILRETGKAAAAKRADRDVSEGVVAIAEGSGAVAGVALVCETDFVAKNDDFIKLAQTLADIVLKNGTTEQAASDPGSIADDSGKTLAQYAEGAVATIRENIQIKKAIKLQGGNYASYLHHDKKSAAIVEISAGGEKESVAGKDVGIQIVAMKPQYISKDELPQDVLAKEMEIEVQRAINEGKPKELAENIAKGRINKEFVKSVVLLEQPFFRDQNISVGQFLTQEGNGVKVLAFHELKVGS